MTEIYITRRRPRTVNLHHHPLQQQEQHHPGMEPANNSLEESRHPVSSSSSSKRRMPLLPLCMFLFMAATTSTNTNNIRRVHGYAVPPAFHHHRRGFAPPPSIISGSSSSTNNQNQHQHCPSLRLTPIRKVPGHTSKRWMVPVSSSSSSFGSDTTTGSGNNQTMMYGASSSTTAERMDTTTIMVESSSTPVTGSTLLSNNGNTLSDTGGDSVNANTNVEDGQRLGVDSHGISEGLPDWLQKKVKESMRLQNNEQQDVPLPTANGGFSHTSSSKAKISAANKGKTPWNKGKGRSEEVKARIAAGVRKRNREKFLQKLKDQGITEEDYNAEEARKKADKEARMKARKTDKGGYRPTAETRAKISKVLKEKWASGQVKKREIDPTKVRRGFTQSEETRAKISASLRKRWADDEDYRANMMNKTYAVNTDPVVRQKISETLRKKWEDPDFRASMTAKMANRTRSSGPREISHREKISKAIKAKWKDEAYRKRATEAMRARQAELMKARPPRVSKPKAVRKTVAKKKAKVVPNQAVTPVSPRLAQPLRATTKPKIKGVRTASKQTAATLAETVNGQVTGTTAPTSPVTKKVVKKKKSVKRKVAPESASPAAAAVPLDPSAPKSAAALASKAAKKDKSKKKKKKEPPGSKTRLREERRDLWDLLYGDTEEEKSSRNGVNGLLDDEDGEDGYLYNDQGGSFMANGAVVGAGSPTRSLASSHLGDEDLDDFDPYGLDD